MFGCSTCMCMYIYIYIIFSDMLHMFKHWNNPKNQWLPNVRTFLGPAFHGIELSLHPGHGEVMMFTNKNRGNSHQHKGVSFVTEKNTYYIYIYIFVHHRVVFLCLVIWQPKINWMKLGWYIHEQSWIYHLSQKKETNIHLKQKVCQCSCSRLWLSALFQKYGILCWHQHHHPHHHPQKTEARTRSKTGQEYVYLGSNFIHMKLQTSQVKESPSHFNRNWTVQLNFPLVN
jgi:hypothetical protein